MNYFHIVTSNVRSGETLGDFLFKVVSDKSDR